MFAYFAKFILWIFGWKVDQNIPKEKSYIILVAPHTSNWDFIVGRLVIGSLKVPQRVLMKKEMFFFPLNILLKSLSAMPIDRKVSQKMVDYVVDLFKEKDDFVFSITPEGTRGYVEKWKTGFYHIATKANVPIVLGKIDYKRKSAGLADVIYPSGNFDKDFKQIVDILKDVTGRNPELYNPRPANIDY
ncbi:MAG: 1-acyl-sn-glycerol-3-phosphate acyltransferase [Bacteroidales bacterium]|jgi:1-acyl-sn-glycerol-3-phosphate acyltransferase|nr:1-acyl-sn-glycerol-3-phosphate acyltransferase [Bacteroidales bacterium]